MSILWPEGRATCGSGKVTATFRAWSPSGEGGESVSQPQGCPPEGAGVRRPQGLRLGSVAPWALWPRVWGGVELGGSSGLLSCGLRQPHLLDGAGTPAPSPSLTCECPSCSRMRGARLMGALLALAGLLQGALALRMAAFNIRTFGETKMSNATLSKYIVQASPGQPVPGEPQRWLWRWLKQVLGREGAAATDGGAAVPGMPSVAGSSPREELRARRGEGAPGNGSSSGAVGTSSEQGHHPRCPPSSAPLWPCPQILSRYDVAVVQEVRDSHLTAVGKLLDTLNQCVTAGVVGREAQGTVHRLM